MNEWQPIETAPTDGTYFLALYIPDGKRHLIPKYGVGCKTQLTGDLVWDWGWAMHPTHWMELPPPPKP